MQLLIGVCMFCEDTCSGNALLCVGRGTNRYLRRLAYFPLTCPLPSQPGVAQLKVQETQTESVCVCLCVSLCVCVSVCVSGTPFVLSLFGVITLHELCHREKHFVLFSC